MEKFKTIGSQEESDNPLVVAKFFTPDSNWQWYAYEFDESERMFFGYIDGLEKEIGYFSLDELETVKGPMGLPIQRDLFWQPKKMSEIVKRV